MRKKRCGGCEIRIRGITIVSDQGEIICRDPYYRKKEKEIVCDLREFFRIFREKPVNTA
jgi:hypothetical protein